MSIEQKHLPIPPTVIADITRLMAIQRAKDLANSCVKSEPNRSIDDFINGIVKNWEETQQEPNHNIEFYIRLIYQAYLMEQKNPIFGIINSQDTSGICSEKGGKNEPFKG